MQAESASIDSLTAVAKLRCPDCASGVPLRTVAGSYMHMVPRSLPAQDPWWVCPASDTHKRIARLQEKDGGKSGSCISSPPRVKTPESASIDSLTAEAKLRCPDCASGVPLRTVAGAYMHMVVLEACPRRTHGGCASPATSTRGLQVSMRGTRNESHRAA